MENRPLVSELIALQQAGQQVEAIQRCLAWLNQHANDQEILHLLSIFYVQLEKFDEAQHYLELALQLDTQNVVMQLHLANIFKAKGLFDSALKQLNDAIKIHPDSAAAYNNLGTLYFAQEKWQAAAKAFQTAINLQPDYVDAYYNLGLAHNKMNNEVAAVSAFEALIQLDSQHVGGHFQLACWLMKNTQYQKALKHFEWLEKQHPHHYETQANLAACYYKLGKLDEAKTHYLKALTIIPEDVTLLFNLGVLHLQQGLIDQAIQFYTQAIQITPDYFEAQYNLGVAFLAQKETTAAMRHLREALRIQPSNEAVRHLLGILTRDPTLTTSSPDYIRTLFDSYADHYDAHLTQTLHYRVPQVFYECLQTQSLPAQPVWDVLDLGCGTGLCGELFKPLARTLTGIDLSEKMLEVAKQKQIYDKLIPADIQVFLQQAPTQTYDCILAGDVLVYFGDLDNLFTQIKRVLKPNGFFLFNAEITEKQDFELTPSGRFAHHKRYLDQLASHHALTIVHYNAIPLREQEHKPVLGHLYLLKNLPSPLAGEG